MTEEADLLNFKRIFVDEIVPGDPFPYIQKIKKISGIYKDIKTSELDNTVAQTPLAIVKPLKTEEICNTWQHTDFFPLKTQIRPSEGLVEVPLRDPLVHIAVNKTPAKESPYIMYSNDALHYRIRKERTIDNMDTIKSIFRANIPVRIGLYKNKAMFLDKDSLDIIECSNLSAHTLKNLPNSIDLAIPEKNMSFIPVIREMEQSKSMLNKKMYLDRIDMSTGKIENYVILCQDNLRKFKRISNTWHPQQFVCVASNFSSIIDLREKQSKVFWNSWNPQESSKPIEYKKHQSAQKGNESKIHIISGKTLGTFDMRNLTSIYGEYSTCVVNGMLAIGRQVAVYNKYGHFFYQSTTDPDNNIVKLYNFTVQDKFLAFDWTGKSSFHLYSLAAFLFRNKICIYYKNGSSVVHKIPVAERKYKEGPTLASFIKKIGKEEPYIKAIIDKPLSKKKKSKPNLLDKPNSKTTYTLLERSIQNGFRDPLEPKPVEESLVPSKDVGKVIEYTKLIDYISMSDRVDIVKMAENNALEQQGAQHTTTQKTKAAGQKARDSYRQTQ